jgi:hypothetical protein
MLNKVNKEEVELLQSRLCDAYKGLASYVESHKDELLTQLKNQFPDLPPSISITVNKFGGILTTERCYWYRDGKWHTFE